MWHVWCTLIFREYQFCDANDVSGGVDDCFEVERREVEERDTSDKLWVVGEHEQRKRHCCNRWLHVAGTQLYFSAFGVF